METEIPLKLRLTMDPNEARLIRDALIKLASDPTVSKEDSDTAWLIVVVLAKKIIGK